MITGIVRFAGALFDHETFRISSAPANFRIDVIFAIMAAGQSALPVLKIPPPDIARERDAVPFLQPCEQVHGFLWHRRVRGVALRHCRWYLNQVTRRRGFRAESGADDPSDQKRERETMEKKPD